MRISAIETVAVSPAVRPELAVAGARGAHDRSDFLLVRVRTTGGVSGVGEVSATLLWSGEDAVTARHAIARALAPALLGQPLVPVAALERRMDRALAGSPFTKAGVATALWDAYARSLGVPLAVALGGPLRERVPVKCSLSGSGARLREVHAAALAAGFRAFKLKVGFDAGTDAVRLAHARELVGPDAFLGLDANGGYGRAEARRFLDLALEHRPAFLEQPVAPADLAGMRELRGLGVPIVADESVFGRDDLVSVIRAEAADVVSLYIGKSGGPGRLVEMAHLADAFGLEVVLGSNGELGLGAAAQIHAACASPGLSARIPSDIIGAHYYAHDVLEHPLALDGRMAGLDAFGAEPGLGVAPAAGVAAGFTPATSS
ncbi:hypothetical protein OIE66_20665 [Nonomuraea sp. NBC_01738]|uniref:mandelate racemase/muconate lactonizing enzyme family protein n=1 Tax=Nonomuraea sp. NBC_01738 TaxID=2976003 RepID=UPI002E11851E|nr:hypothetical protein OIE66_20665 [Nonomuraea sp. NBC_01738]